MSCQHDQTKPAPTLRALYPLYPERVMVWACNVCQCQFRLPLTEAI